MMRKLVAAIFVFVVILGAVRQGDVLSCERSNIVRHAQIGYSKYAYDAAVARRSSAQLEWRTNPKQARVDLKAADAFLSDVSQIKIHLIDCGGVFPTTK